MHHLATRISPAIKLGLPKRRTDSQGIHDDITQPDPPDRASDDAPHPTRRIGDVSFKRRDERDEQRENAGEESVVKTGETARQSRSTADESGAGLEEGTGLCHVGAVMSGCRGGLFGLTAVAVYRTGVGIVLLVGEV